MDLLVKHRHARTRDFGPYPLTKFQKDMFLHLREGRLLALAYPGMMERMALMIAENPAAEAHDRSYAVYLLGILASKGGKNSEHALFSLASANDDLSVDALRSLYGVDDAGLYRGLYWRKCPDLSTEALRMVGTWQDPRTTALMRDLIESSQGKHYPESEIRGLATLAIEQVEIISGLDWSSRLEPILLDPAKDPHSWGPWAMRVARMRSLPNLLQIYRKRLDRGSERVRRIEEGGADEGVKPGYSESEFLSAYHMLATGDPYFDDVLVAYAELGGQLTDLEGRRLRTFGYACDPKERLAELLAGLR